MWVCVKNPDHSLLTPLKNTNQQIYILLYIYIHNGHRLGHRMEQVFFPPHPQLNKRLLLHPLGRSFSSSGTGMSAQSEVVATPAAGPLVTAATMSLMSAAQRA